MPLPQPKVPLKDHCTVIYNGKLYAYQADAFQTLDLKEGGTWSQLSIGVATTGSACVQGSVNDDPAFILVGGTTSEDWYQGFQHYSFKDAKWTSDQPLDSVATDRTRHGAAFLQQSSQILTYGGSQDNDSTPSSQTFVLSTTPPCNTQAFESQAPPVTNPLMTAYNSTHALMLGGSPTDNGLFLFSSSDGWSQLNATLQNPLKDSSKVQASIFTGSDGGKLLQIFDMSATPNEVSTVLLQNASPQNHKRSASYISSPHHPTKRRKRDTSILDRPAYNNTLAPQDSRTGYSLATDPTTGLVVATGGNDQAPLAMFNMTGNQWVDPNQFFGDESSASPSPASTAPPAAPTASSTANPSAVAKADNDAHNKSLTILGGVLGGVLGAAVLLIVLLVCLRYQRKKRAKKEEQRKNDFAMEQKEMDFRDIGADFMKEAGGSNEGSRHGRKQSDGSGKKKDHSRAASSMSKRALLPTKGDSAGSNNSFWSRGTKSPERNARSPPQISAPIMGPSFTRSIASPEPKDGVDTGFSRYFSGNPHQGMHLAPGTDERHPTSYSSNTNTHSQSDYASTNLHESAEVEPLSFRPSQLGMPSNARSVSPSNHHPPPGLGVALTHGISRPSPPHSKDPPTPSVVSDIEEEEASDYRHSNGQDSWSPVESGSEPRTSQYTDETRPNTNSFGAQHPGQRIQIPEFPMPSARNSTATSPISPQGTPQPQQPQVRKPGLRNVVSRDLIRSNSARQRATDLVRTGTQRMTPNSTEPPTYQPQPQQPRQPVQPFPRPRPRQQDDIPRGRPSSETEDMSWLNLGTSVEANGHGADYFGRPHR